MTNYGETNKIQQLTGNTLNSSLTQVRAGDWVEARIVCLTPNPDYCSFNVWAEYSQDYSTWVAMNSLARSMKQVSSTEYRVTEIWGLIAPSDGDTFHVSAPINYIPGNASLVTEISGQ
jgi:hypothetical protein